jgi:hypothetical protein
LSLRLLEILATQIPPKLQSKSARTIFSHWKAAGFSPEALQLMAGVPSPEANDCLFASNDAGFLEQLLWPCAACMDFNNQAFMISTETG